ncbi:hypothetical protein BXY66_1561 [Shimia isoporae]|uniref:CAAX prenyl protease 2/Lysostaphin resistance protein A-like domain-containing protein n=1 Tax=Shimia isoporae TaxID=647720 RepID=A0A4R1NWJ5_9RHOB|nr:type II CAAX endopeptidase family protein [Shimia isoporae]TCL09512.1 hypothetical protein BXY66_1561 [Shimia isoporae]
MREIVVKHPALCLTVLAMVFGIVPLWAVSAGFLPKEASQLGALSASLAGFVLAFLTGGAKGFYNLLKRGLKWRVGLGWWAFALVFPVIPSVAALYLYSVIGGPQVTWDGLDPIWKVVPLILLLTLLAGFGEEFGWRGFAMPRLQARFGALASCLCIGCLWGLWHLPLFMVEGTVQNDWLQDAGWIVAIGGYVVFCMAWSVQFGWVFNNTGGSVLVAAVMHGAGNAWFGGYVDVYRGDFGGVLVFTVVMAVVSGALVAVSGAENLSRKETRVADDGR